MSENIQLDASKPVRSFYDGRAHLRIIIQNRVESLRSETDLSDEVIARMVRDRLCAEIEQDLALEQPSSR